MKALFATATLLLMMLYKISAKRNYHSKEKEVMSYISSFNCGGQYVMLTFSNGPHPIVTPKILDILANYSIKATFFVYGERASHYPDILKRITKEGHEVAHQGFYVDFSKNNKDAQTFTRNLALADEVISKITEKSSSLIYRPPIQSLFHDLELGTKLISVSDSPNLLAEQRYRQHVNKKLKDFKESLGDSKIILWSLTATDFIERKLQDLWLDHNSFYKAVNTMCTKAKPGDIILAHDTQALWIPTLPNLINKLTNSGYEFVTISEMLKFPDDTPR